MLRIIGILTGAALAVALIIIAVGVPEFSRPDPARESPAFEPPQEDPVGEVTAEAVPEPSPPVEPEPVPEPEPAEAAPVAAEPDADLGFGGWQPAPEPVDAASERETLAADPSVPVEEHWYAFWSPFRSEIAANGFVSRLQETTGMDYRVVKVKTGVYEVAFAYTDDADIEDKLARISNATGLDMSGG